MMPHTKFVKKIEVNSILEFFQQIWPAKQEEYKDVYQRFKEAFGCQFYGMGHLSNRLTDPWESLEYIYPQFTPDDYDRIDPDAFFIQYLQTFRKY